MTEQANPWKEAVIEALIVNHTLRKEHEEDPKLALAALIDWECKIALDPAVSSEAQALIDKGRKEALPSQEWSEEDEKWLQMVPEPLRATAKRHGRALFSISMHAGAIGHAMGEIQRMNAGNRRVGQALLVLQSASNDLCLRALAQCGKTAKDLQACQQDINFIGAVAEQELDRQAGKIILPN